MEKNQQGDDVESGKPELYCMNENEGDGEEIGVEWMDEYFNTCPEGYKFVPTDEEIVELLVKKYNNEPLPLEDLPLYNLYLADPSILFNIHNEEEAYYLTKPMRPEQEAGDGRGYWKSGAEMLITSNGQLVGYRKALDFYRGKQPGGRKTGWKMHEYRINKTGYPSNPPEGADAMKLDDYLICKVYKEGESETENEQQEEKDGGATNLGSGSASTSNQHS